MDEYVAVEDQTDVEEMFGLEDELDLENESTITPQRANFEVTDVEILEKENGKLARVEFSNLDVLPYPISETFWLRHTNEKAQKIGRGGLKRLFKAAFGEPKGTVANLMGLTISGWVKEDANGYTRLSSFQKAAAVEDEA